MTKGEKDLLACTIQEEAKTCKLVKIHSLQRKKNLVGLLISKEKQELLACNLKMSKSAILPISRSKKLLNLYISKLASLHILKRCKTCYLLSCILFQKLASLNIAKKSKHAILHISSEAKNFANFHISKLAILLACITKNLLVVLFFILFVTKVEKL